MPKTALQMPNLSAKDAMRDAAAVLRQAGIEGAQLDARLLMEHVLGVSREQLLADDTVLIDSPQMARYQDVVARRAHREPLSHLVGRREFFGLDFSVTADTLDPRPDSETLIEAVLEKYKDRNAPLRILDLGTGTGCLLITLLKMLPQATGVGVDISEAALKVAQENAMRLGVASHAEFVVSRWNEQVRGKFDIVISNPPYIPTQDIATLMPEVSCYEPKLALDGGMDGLECYRQIMAQLPGLLEPQGLAVFEIGQGQEDDMTSVAALHGLHVADMKKDMAGVVRCVLVQQQNG